MALYASASGGSFKQIEPGTYVGVCYRIVDLGTQHSEFNGEEKTAHQVLISWEFPDELIAEGEYEGQPYSVSKFYTLSLHEKASLCKDLQNWRGRPFSDTEKKKFDIGALLGKACLVQVAHTEAGKAKVVGVMALPKGTQAPTGVNEQTLFSLCEYDPAAFSALPEGIQKIVRQSDEWALVKDKFEGKGSAAAGDDSDDVPF